MRILVPFLGALCVTAGVSAAQAAPDPALLRAIASPDRTPNMVARDPARHPAEELSFFGVTPSSSVIEIWPGGGYWTQILAPLLHDHGRYTIAMGPQDGDRTERHFALSPDFQAMLAAHPADYDRLHTTRLGAHDTDLGPPDSADIVLTFRNLHNWMEAGDTAAILAGIRAVLKPGGILGVEDHRANTKTPQDPKAENGYVRQDYAIALIEKAGFKLVGSSEIDANPRDDADHPKGVWTLPPTYALGATDHAKYEAIGEADNFVLKFRKIGT
ncbi:methyltransferase [Acetobacteraceae bacterium KSS8]|uniref:Methyltransferase n=1 Tax=Endosaccharibacter trunci TaxID=2812733 RepID=A0ABT1W955_9PROT|nr:methyltransferase [Acetobacteraceae bacterium KSS8]